MAWVRVAWKVNHCIALQIQVFGVAGVGSSSCQIRSPK